VQLVYTKFNFSIIIFLFNNLLYLHLLDNKHMHVHYELMIAKEKIFLINYNKRI